MWMKNSVDPDHQKSADLSPHYLKKKTVLSFEKIFALWTLSQ